ncbi:MAG: response regulator [Acidimicrobiales bacterium]|jgi:CheY-like chemotaxis protein|nr:response regulator [Acidimicrobiales bacterium]
MAPALLKGALSGLRPRPDAPLGARRLIVMVVLASLEATMDWDVMTAQSGAEGLCVAGDTSPDAILLDMMMPVMDGRAVLAELAADAALADVPVVLFTAKLDSLSRHDHELLGCAGLIVKPYDPLTLGDQVVEILRWGD